MSADASYPWLNQYPSHVDWHKEYTPRPVFDMLSDTVSRFPTNPAFDFLGKGWSWGEIGALVDRMAKGLQAAGVVKDTKVGIFLPNCPYFLVSYFAIMKAGGTVVNFNPLYVERELVHQINDSETKIMITLDLEILYTKMKTCLKDSDLEKILVCPFTAILPFPKSLLFKVVKGKELADVEYGASVLRYDDVMSNDGKPAPVSIDAANDVAVLQYTGGTTGTPKGAMLTHGNIMANTEQATEWLGGDMPDGEGRMLGVLPFFHVFAMTAVMNFSVKLGFEIIALPRFDLNQALKLIDKRKPHYFPAVPAIYNGVNNSPKADKYDLTSLRFCISGGAALPAEVKKQFEQKTGCTVVEGYGLTESAPVVCCNPPSGANKPGSIGLPFPSTTVVLLDPEDKVTPVKQGEKGELCVRGPQVMKGYWKKDDETANVMQNGFLHTGDIAIMDEDGYFFIVDRIKDLIITNGYNVYPRQVEEAIYLHADVEECIVAGIPDSQRGEIVKAWVKPKDGKTITEDALKEFLTDKLSKIERPRLIEVRSEPLPKTMIGKLSRKDILAEEKAQ
jgi:long-chain acyl-CoA synthetase